MQFSEFLLSRLSFLERSTRGYGNCISERALFQSLTEQGLGTDDFFVLVQWGILQSLLIEQDTVAGRRFIIDRQVLADLRARANGEIDKAVDHDPTASGGSIKPDTLPDPDSDQT